MITVNNKELTWYEGMTVGDILVHFDYTYPALMVTINNKHILGTEYALAVVHEGDDIKIIHPICGG